MKDSERYVNALIKGDERIIKEIYTNIFPKIKSYILKNRGDLQDASDVFHDGLMYLIVTQKEKRTEIQSFEAYLFVICKNLWKKTLKKRVIKTDPVTLVDKESELSTFVVEQQLFDFYIEKFNLLSINCKEILSSYFNGLSYDDILIEHAYSSINTVRQRVFKCRSKLISLIKKDKLYLNMKQWH